MRRSNRSKRAHDSPTPGDSSRPKRACATNVNYLYSPPETFMVIRQSPDRPNNRKSLNTLVKAYGFRSRSRVNYSEKETKENNHSSRESSNEKKQHLTPARIAKARSSPVNVTPASDDSDFAPANPASKKRAKKIQFVEPESASEGEVAFTPPRRSSRSSRKRGRSVESQSADEHDVEIEDTGRYPKRKATKQSYARFFGAGMNAFITPPRNQSSNLDGMVRKYNFRRMNKETRAKLSHLYSLPEPVFEERLPQPRPKAKANGADDAEDNDDETNVLLPLNFQEIISTRPGITIPDTIPTFSPIKKAAMADIGGLGKQIQIIKESLLLPTLYPDFIQDFGINPVRGILFHGPPGTGKTMTAQALVEECSQSNTPIAFFHINANDILSKWVGKSETKIQKIFTIARQWQPSVVFIDEIDGITPPRSSSDRHNASLVAALLSQMDGIDNSGQVLVIGATNRLHAIDPALRRSGRFEEALYFPLPDLVARKSILGITAAMHNLSPEDLSQVAALTSGYSGADLASLCARAGKAAFFRSHPLAASLTAPADCCKDIQVGLEDFKLAISQITPTSKLQSNVSYSPLPQQLSHFSSKVQGAIAHLQKTSPHHQLPYFLPRVLLVRGKDELASHHVTSAILHGLDNFKVTPLDLSTFSTSDDSSDLKDLKLKLQNMSPNGQRGITLMQHADIVLETISAELFTPIRAALTEPGVGGDKNFLFTTPSMTPELESLLMGLQVVLLNMDEDL